MTPTLPKVEDFYVPTARALRALGGSASIEEIQDKLTETCVSSETVFQGRLMHAKRDVVSLHNGHETTREYLIHPGAVLVVNDDQIERVLVEREVRQGGRFEFKKKSGLFRRTACARCVRVIRHDGTDAPAQTDFRSDRCQQRCVAASKLQ